MKIDNANITFSVAVDNTVWVCDATEYEPGWACFEWFQNSEESVVASRACKTEDYNSWTAGKLPDGKLTYYKLVVPSQREHPSPGDLSWKQEGDKIILTQYLDDVWKQVGYVAAFGSAFEEMGGKYNDDESSYYPGAAMFLLGNIKKCLSELQLAYIYDSLRHECTTENKNKRDFIQVAVEVLKYLIISQAYDEAQSILDELSFCGFLCEDTYNKTIGCGCGK